MDYLLSLIYFDCKLERFAEVFGDILETEDINGFYAEAVGVCPAVPDRVGEVYEDFDRLDSYIMDELNRERTARGFEPADLKTLRAFYRFVNDCYLWEDLEDLERFETELFDSLTGYEQKNYDPMVLYSDKASRRALFNRFARYILARYGEGFALEVLALTVKDIIGGI